MSLYDDPLSDEGGTSLYEGTWLVEPDVADLLGRALLFAAGDGFGGTSVESFEDGERWRMAEAGAELRRKAAEHGPSPKDAGV